MTETPKTRVLIGTPAYGGMCCVSYTTSLIQSIKHCATLGIDVVPTFLANESLIPRARNTIVAKFMNDPSYTHLLFIDADVNWSPTAIPRLLDHDKDIVGALYPKKGYDWQRLIKNKEVLAIINGAANENRDLTDTEINHIRTKLLSYVANLSGVQTKIENNLISLRHIGTGFMMIKRATLQRMMDALPQLKHDDDIGALTTSENKYLYSLFDCEIHQLTVKKHYLSEDYLFCKRWTDMGGLIHADVTISLTHTGPHAFTGNFAVSNNLTRPINVAEPQAQLETKLEPTEPSISFNRVPVTTPTLISTIDDAIKIAPTTAPTTLPIMAPTKETTVVTKKQRMLPSQLGQIKIV